MQVRGGRSRWGPAPSTARHLAALRYLAGDLVAALVAAVVLVVVVAVALLSLVGVGVLLAGPTSGLVRRWGDHERARTGRRLGRRVASPHLDRTDRGLAAVRRHLAGGTLRRELGALLLRATAGVPLATFALLLPVSALGSAAVPLFWWAIPGGEVTVTIVAVTSWWGALVSAVVGSVALVVWWWTAARVADIDATVASHLLSPSAEHELRMRAEVEQHRRRSAISAHTAELKRIERDLHDSAQNRMVAVALFVGMAQRQLATGHGDAEAALDQARRAADDALGELRRVVQGIYPPVLTEAGLVPALGQLVDQNHVPSRLHVVGAAATPAAVDAALYFSVAEALTNVSKHSGATAAEVELLWEGDEDAPWVVATVTDDGRGGADPGRGSGLAGIGDRLEALGGQLTVTSPPGGPTTIRMEVPCAPS